jgi:hypothetical protein
MLLLRNQLDGEQTDADSYQQKPLQRYTYLSLYLGDSARYRQREYGQIAGRPMLKAEQRTDLHRDLLRKCCNFIKGLANARVPY